MDKVERIVIRRKTWLQRAVAGVKASLTAVSFSRSTFWSFNERGSTSLAGGIDYRERAGDGRSNAIVVAGLDLLGNTFAQSPPQVKQLVSDQQNVVTDHDMTRLLLRPNPYYGGELLWKATIIDYIITGNAYWLKVRSGADGVAQLYWVPSTLIHPEWPKDNAKVFISHYEYNPNGKPENIAVSDVVHFRNGMDPKNVRKGLSPLGALLREIATDEEAAEMTNTVLRNLGVTGFIVSPGTDKGKITEPDAVKIKQSIMLRTTGDRRGEPVVVGGNIKIDQMSHDISKLDLAGIRHVPEERITSILGTPAVLLGLGTGLENATFSNVDGLRRIFYENKVIPLQTFIGADLHVQLLPDFEGDNTSDFEVGFDNTNVRVLKEDEDKQVERWLKEVETGALTINEYRALRGRDAYEQDFYALNSRIIPVRVEDIVKKATVQDAPDTTGTADNGGGSADSGSGSGNSNPASASADDGNKGYRPNVSTKDIGETVDRIRMRMSGQCTTDVYGYLSGQMAYVITQVQEQDKTKIRINWPRVQEDYETLKGVLEPWYKRALVAVHDVVQDVLDTRYELSSSDERTYLKSAALNIKGINEHTRQQVADAVKLSAELDESIDELVSRIRTLGAFSMERATLIAQTELATTTNLAQIESYRASEVVVGIRVTDGDMDTVCANLNGKRVKISEARSIPPLGHPRCVRRFWHITDVRELEDSEAA